jgi:sugar transferase (PEP-CTERM/EpsH1 system associated)
MDSRPLVLHVVYRFDVGGLENGVVNLINHLPATGYRHAVLALTQVTDFRRRVSRGDVEFMALDKPPGHALPLYPAMVRLFRRLRPAIVHTRNLAALEAVVPAWIAGVPVRIHGEHGVDVDELRGRQRRYRLVRRLYRPFVSHFVTVSRPLQRMLVEDVGAAPERVTRICNGVDALRFRPRGTAAEAPAGWPFSPEHWVVGTVGRMQAVKDPVLLARAFVTALRTWPSLRQRLRLVMVGDGPLRSACRAVLQEAGADDLTWLPGERADVPQVMRALDAFVLPSLSEGVSNTLLEAMASGLPVVATDVGANGELVEADVTGRLVPAGEVEALAAAIADMAQRPDAARAMGQAGRRRAEEQFSLRAMVGAYHTLYDTQLATLRTPVAASAPRREA